MHKCNVEFFCLYCKKPYHHHLPVFDLPDMSGLVSIPLLHMNKLVSIHYHRGLVKRTHHLLISDRTHLLWILWSEYYISLLIIPCITYYVTNKETLNLEPWNGNVLFPVVTLPINSCLRSKPTLQCRSSAVVSSNSSPSVNEISVFLKVLCVFRTTLSPSFEMMSIGLVTFPTCLVANPTP